MSEVPLCQIAPSHGRAVGNATGIPDSKETASSQDPTVDLCLGPYGGPRGVEVASERGTPVWQPLNLQMRGYVSFCKSAFHKAFTLSECILYLYRGTSLIRKHLPRRALQWAYA